MWFIIEQTARRKRTPFYPSPPLSSPLWEVSIHWLENNKLVWKRGIKWWWKASAGKHRLSGKSPQSNPLIKLGEVQQRCCCFFFFFLSPSTFRLLGNWDGFSSRWPGAKGLLAGCGKCSGFLLAVRRGRGNGGTTARSKAWPVFVLSSKFRCRDGIRECECSSGVYYVFCSSLGGKRN